MNDQLSTTKTADWLTTRSIGTNELLESFLSGKSERTIKAYQQDLESFREFIGSESVTAACELLVSLEAGQANLAALRFRAKMMQDGLAPATVNRRLAALRSIVKLARTLGMVTWAIEVENLKAQKMKDTRGPGVGGVQSILRVANRTRAPKKRARDVCIIRLLFEVALRRGEVASLTLDDVDLPRRAISVMGKGRHEKEMMTIPESTAESLEQWLLLRGDEPGSLFTNFDRAGKGCGLTGTSIHRLIRGLGKKAGIKVWPHGLRHTAITTAVSRAQAAGIDLEEVCDFSRHASVATLMIYRDRHRNVQGQIAELVAGSLSN